MFTLGVDPGITGGWALFHENTLIDVGTFPSNDDSGFTRIDFAGMCLEFARLRHLGAQRVHIERGIALPGQAVKAAVTQGYNMAVLHCAATSSGLEVIEEPPIAWATWLHRFVNRVKDSKKDTFAALGALGIDLSIIPRGPRSGKPHSGIVDAAGIAVYAAVRGRYAEED